MCGRAFLGTVPVPIVKSNQYFLLFLNRFSRSKLKGPTELVFSYTHSKTVQPCRCKGGTVLVNLSLLYMAVLTASDYGATGRQHKLGQHTATLQTSQQTCLHKAEHTYHNEVAVAAYRDGDVTVLSREVSLFAEHLSPRTREFIWEAARGFGHHVCTSCSGSTEPLYGGNPVARKMEAGNHPA